MFDAEAGALAADRTIGGSVVLRCAVDALFSLKDVPKDGQRVNVEEQLLPSALKYGDKLVAYSNAGHARGAALNERAPYRISFSADIDDDVAPETAGRPAH